MLSQCCACRSSSYPTRAAVAAIESVAATTVAGATVQSQEMPKSSNRFFFSRNTSRSMQQWSLRSCRSSTGNWIILATIDVQKPHDHSHHDHQLVHHRLHFHMHLRTCLDFDLASCVCLNHGALLDCCCDYAGRSRHLGARSSGSSSVSSPSLLAGCSVGFWSKFLSPGSGWPGLTFTWPPRTSPPR